MEAGNRAVSGLELGRLAYLFGRDLGEFLGDQFRDQDVLGALFRAQPAITQDPAVLDKLRECVALGRELGNLEALLGTGRPMAFPATYLFAQPRNRWEAVQQGEQTAIEERRRLGLGVGPVPSLHELLDTQGVRTGLVDLPDEVSGIAFTDRTLGLFVVANRRHHELRRRFSFAHEYGHVLLDRARATVISLASDREELPEVRANSFAASFLMPAEGVQHFVAALGKGLPSRQSAQVFDGEEAVAAESRTAPGTQDIQIYDVVQVAHHFGVSRSTAIYRLKNLKLLSQEEATRLHNLDDDGHGKAIAKLLGLPDIDHEKARNEFRRRFLGLALEAYRRSQISKAKVSELATMVGLTAQELASLIEGAGLANRNEDEADLLLLPGGEA
jgi:Zn-dependent peptidase ImmA (M78 family)